MEGGREGREGGGRREGGEGGREVEGGREGGREMGDWKEGGREEVGGWEGGREKGGGWVGVNLHPSLMNCLGALSAPTPITFRATTTTSYKTPTSS